MAYDRRRMIPTWAKGSWHGVSITREMAIAAQHCPTCEAERGEPCNAAPPLSYMTTDPAPFGVHMGRRELVAEGMARDLHDREVALLVEFLRDHVDILGTEAVPVERLVVR